MPSTRIDIFTRIKGKGEVNRLSRDMEKLQSQVNSVSRSFRDVVQGALAVGAGLLVLGPRVASAFTKPIRAAGDLQFELSGVRALIQGQFDDAEDLEDAFGKLSDQAKALGETTQFTASQSAQAMQFLARAGFDANEIFEALPGTLNLAAVEAIDLATAADIASNVLTGTGKSTEEFNDVVDILAATTTNANTNLIQLAEALKTAAPVASSAGVDLVELNAVIGALGNGGLQASIAGTSLRRIITQLTQPTDKARVALAKLGLSFDDFQDTSGDFVGVIETIELLEENLDKVGGTAERAQVLGDIFGQIATPGVNVLLKQGSENLTELSKKLNDSVASLGKQGVAAQIAETRLDNLQGSTTRLSSAYDGLLINAGDPFLDFARSLVDVVKSAISAVSNFTQEFPFLSQALISTFAAVTAITGAIVGLVAVIGFVLIAFTSFAKISAVLAVALPGVSAAIAFLGGAVSAILGPLAILAGALALGEILSQTILGFSLFSLKLSEVATFIKVNFVRGLLLATLGLKKVILALNNVFGSAESVKEVASDISLITKELEELEKQQDATAQSVADRISASRGLKNTENGFSDGGRKTESLAEAEKIKNDQIRKQQKALDDAARKERLRKEKEEQAEKDLLRNQSIEKIKQEIVEITNLSQKSQENIQAVFDKQRELATIEFSSNPDKQIAEIERINQQQIAKERDIERERIAATNRVEEARIQAIENEQKREILSLEFRQQKELDQLRNGASASQIVEFRKIQEKQINDLIIRQSEDTARKRIEIENFIEDVRIRTIEDSFEKQKIIFETRQKEELEEFKNLSKERLGISQEEIDARAKQLEKLQEKELEIFEERQKLEESQRQGNLDREFLELDFGRTNDPLEKIRIQSELELSEFRSLQERKLEQLREFGASEQQLDEQRILLKQDLARRQAEISQEAFDAQLALGADTVGGAKDVAQKLLDISKGNSKELFLVTQGLAIAEATINVARAISASIGAEGFFGVAKAAIAGAAAAAELARIGSVTLGFNEGGFVPGNRSVNRDSVPAVLTPGEAVISQPRVRAYGAENINGLIRGTIPKSIFNGAPGRGLSPTTVKSRYNTGGIVSAPPRQNSAQPAPPTIIVQNKLSDDTVMGTVSKPENFQIIKNMIRDDQDDIFGGR